MTVRWIPTGRVGEVIDTLYKGNFGKILKVEFDNGETKNIISTQLEKIKK